MKRFLLTGTFLAASAALAVTSVHGPADAASRWRIDFTPGKFSYVVVGSGTHGRVQYYLPYTVTNGSDAGRKARPRLEIKTDKGTTFGDHFDARAYKAIKKKTRKDANPTSSLGKSDLSPGASADAVAHFGRMDDTADRLALHVHGLWDPIVREKDGKLWNERRVLVVKFRRYGDEYRRYMDTIHLESREAIREGQAEEVPRAAKPGS